MTPSGWHDDARSRDAGHDEMQAAVWRWASTYIGESEGDLAWATIEYPFIVGGRYERIVAFGDVVGKLHGEDRYIVWEIKPKIDSVGAVMRQLASLQFAISQVTDVGKKEFPSGRPYPTTIQVVVPALDPKLPLLRELSKWGVVPWDMALGEPVP